ncbi:MULTISPECIES: tagaturonate reductase [unclassified Janthinobacterium]|uniref:tagaturonate reductase n=1 Tax=unclassified Janthinobacterium TaxID=2610881 RepID=UPI0016086D85|nr:MULTISPECIES: tagaturonate reductase [unclassified Janthinobacterium]MBB5368061.1 tagaturonate reductase [Janthinobacterium sp. K2C7]MBB5379461.1 tagaturonate reductase [Janthinobacterium sp. K2Li3]MBB5386443.1 tagaturonate reductase [Janthinobacterium sp. K2E3]
MQASVSVLQRSAPFDLPIKFLQFGQGNFMRGFFDWQVDLLNERTGLNGGVVVVRPRGGSGSPLLDVQDGLFTTIVRGLDEDGQAVSTCRTIRCVQREIDPSTMYGDYLALASLPELRFIVSNTTEAGIAVNDSDAFEDSPPSSFPAKLARLLFERYTHFEGDRNKGLVLLPCELIERNGPALKAAVLHFARLWQLDAGFADWLDGTCVFCSTLVDRIVTGYPEGEAQAIEEVLGYRDQFLVAAEHYYLFVIEGPQWLADELKLAGAGLNIQLVDDITPYKKRKVGILNGGHTALVPVALLAGLDTVGAAVSDEQVGGWLADTLAQEIIPALPLPQDELQQFARDVLLRFRNPYIQHRLSAIALNSWSKFAARIAPQMLRYVDLHGRLPQRLVLALAATMRLYRGDVIVLSDDAASLAWFGQGWFDVDSDRQTLLQLAQGWLANDKVWGRDMNVVIGLAQAVAAALQRIEQQGMRGALQA